MVIIPVSEKLLLIAFKVLINLILSANLFLIRSQIIPMDSSQLMPSFQSYVFHNNGSTTLVK